VLFDRNIPKAMGRYSILLENGDSSCAFQTKDYGNHGEEIQ
jgi:hypothetical protein